jgi:dipeptidyl aminopeptidase/acylaminoacyl peptidase
MSKGARPLAVEDLLRFVSISDVQLSPDGQRVAYVVNSIDAEADATCGAIWLVGALGGEPVQFSEGAAKDSAPRWSPDGERLAFLSDRSGKPQLYVARVNGGEARRFTDLPDGAGLPVWSPDGASIAFSARVEAETPPEDPKQRERWARRPRHVTTTAYKADGAGYVNDKRSRIFVVPAAGGEARATTQLDVNATDPAWSPDGAQIAYISSRPEDRDLTHPFGLFGTTDLFVMSAGGDQPRKLATLAALGQPSFSPDGRTIAVYSSGFDGDDLFARTHIWLVPLDGGAPRELSPELDRSVVAPFPPMSAAPPAWSADAARLYTAIGDRGNTHLYAVPSDGSPAEALLSGERRILPWSYAPAAGRFAFAVSDPRTPSDLFVAAADGSDERRLTHLNATLLAGLELAPAERRTFATPHGPIEGWLRLPVGGGLPAPLLVPIHGGPAGAFGSEFLPIEGDISHLAAANGWAVLALNPSGSGSYGRAFMQSLVEAWGEYDLPEQLAAVDALIAEGIADPERLAVTGYSYGGYMTAWIVGHTDRFKAAIIGAPVTNVESMTGASDAGIGLSAAYFGGHLTEARETYRRLSPMTYIDRVTTPCLVLHGEADDRCPISQGEEWFTALRAQGKHAEMVRYPGGSHGFRSLGPPSHRLDYARRVLDWLSRYVPAKQIEQCEAIASPAGD